MRGSVCMGVDSDQGLAVPALVDERELEAERGTAVALADHAPTGGEDGGHELGQVRGPMLRLAVWRIEEDQIVGGTAGVCVPQYPPNVTLYHGRLQSERVQVGADRRDGARRAVAEERASGAPRERLDPQGAGAREEVEHRFALQRAEDGEQRLAHAVGGRARVEPPRGLQAAPPEGAGDDPHVCTT